MVLDSSAAVAVVREEDGHDRLEDAIADATHLAIGAPTLLETAMVLVGYFGPRGNALLSRFLESNEVMVIGFDHRHYNVAAEAFVRYGKGRHPAALNYGDCMTYAIARIAEHPLLFVGDDFAKTDLPAAIG
jgi:ribonuclease VapC